MSSPQDPFAPPSEGDQPQGGQPPYGAQPPAPGQPPTYGQQPPAYGQQPPAYGQQSPAYGQQPPAYGQQPPAYGQAPYGGAPAYGPPPGQGYGGGPLYPKNSLGVWSIVLAGVAFFCAGPLASIPGVILGHLALKANKEQTANNQGLSMAGTIINWVITIGYVALLVWVFAFGGLEWYFGILEDSMTTG